MLGQAGVPSTGVDAVIVTLTAVETADASHVTAVNASAVGYATAWPGGESRSATSTSTVNVSGPGDTRAAGVVMATGDSSDVAFHTAVEMDLIGDVSGYLTR